MHDSGRWWALAVLCLSLTIVVVDDTVLNVALPALVAQLGATTSQLQWAVDSYIVVFGGLLFWGGSTGDRLGRRRALFIGLILFGAFSALAAFAPTPGWLIAARACQGIGGALIMPSTVSLIVHVFPAEELGHALGVWSGASGLGIVLGPVLAGLLLNHFWWGSVFLINVPVVGVALWGGRLWLPESRPEITPPFDRLGTLLSIGGFSTLLWAIIESPELAWGATLGLSTLALLLLAVFVAWELRSPHPMVEVRFLARRAMAVPAALIAGAFFLFVGTAFGLTQYLQLVRGCTPLLTGLVMAPLSVAWSGMAPFSQPLCRRWGERRVIAAGLAASGLALMSLVWAGTGTPLAQVVGALLVLGGGMGTVSTPVTRLIVSSVPPEYSGMASATNSVSRQVGAALGVAVLGSLLAGVYRTRLEPLGRPELLEGLGHVLRAAPDLAGPARAAFLQGFRLTNQVSCLLALTLAALALAVLKRIETEDQD